MTQHKKKKIKVSNANQSKGKNKPSVAELAKEFYALLPEGLANEPLPDDLGSSTKALTTMQSSEIDEPVTKKLLSLPDDKMYLLEFLEKSNKPLKLDSILRALHIKRNGKEELEENLYALQKMGHAVRIKGAWTSCSRLKQATGVLQIQKTGVGFVLQNKPGTKDVFVHPANFEDALHGDTVRIIMLPVPKGAKPEGKIIEILERSTQEQGAIAQKLIRDGLWICTSSNQRLPVLFEVNTEELPAQVKKGDLLLVKILEKTTTGAFKAIATANLASEDNPKTQEQLGKSNHNIPTEFTPDVIEQANKLPENPEENDFLNRKDLRHLDFVTIDGEDAKDFDDAIYVEELKTPELTLPAFAGKYIPHGAKPSAAKFRLMVAIADVSHYVPAGSALDTSANLRGNSYYFPMSVEPMFPEALSNGLCSLRPDVPRLVMVADMLYSDNGQLLAASFYPAVITSKARLTYTGVKKAILDNEAEEQAKIPHVLPMLQKAHSLALAIAAKRTQRGSLDFDLPEAQIHINETGQVDRISPRERTFAHQLIEEFMVAANEAVASYLTQEQVAVLYRIHPLPAAEKLENLLKFLGQTGLVDDLLSQTKTKKKNQQTISASLLQKIMEKVKDTPKAYTVNRMILRSMMQAKYSTENEEHFGLASPCYCHFTSPIRRYADLTVHRNLKAAIGFKGFPQVSAQNLEYVATHINTTERHAIEAEREVQKRLTILYLKDKVGERYAGVISGVTDFGMFIELPEMLIEGMVRLSSLNDDYYELWEDRQELRGRNTGRVFTLGQSVNVVLEDVSLEKLEINLRLERTEQIQEKNRLPQRKAKPTLNKVREKSKSSKKVGSKKPDGGKNRAKKS